MKSWVKLWWHAGYLLSRVLWIGISVFLVYGASLVFHRFDIKQKIKSSKKKTPSSAIDHHGKTKSIAMTMLPAVTTDYSIKGFVKAEMLMLFRKGSRWLWLLNIGLFIAMIFVPLPIAHEFLLPILWFLQVSRISEITTKEKSNRVHLFTFAAYRPLTRLLPAQILSGISFMLLLALPLLTRHLIAQQFPTVFGIVSGSIFIVLLAAGLGIATGGKKLFEILFFLITYANLNRIPFADYFGFAATTRSVVIVLLLSFCLAAISAAIRGYEIKHS